MQDINNYIKENDTDNVNIKMIDDIVFMLVDDEDDYEDDYGTSETIAEALEKLKRALYWDVIKRFGYINDFNDSFFYLNVNSGRVSVYGQRNDNNSWKDECNSLLINTMKFDLNDVTNSKVVNGEIEVGTFYPWDNITQYAIVNGVINGICTINGVKQMCMLRFETPESGNTNVYLILNDTSVLTSTSQTLSIMASGSLNYEPKTT